MQGQSAEYSHDVYTVRSSQRSVDATGRSDRSHRVNSAWCQWYWRLLDVRLGGISLDAEHGVVVERWRAGAARCAAGGQWCLQFTAGHVADAAGECRLIRSASASVVGATEHFQRARRNFASCNKMYKTLMQSDPVAGFDNWGSRIGGSAERKSHSKV